MSFIKNGESQISEMISMDTALSNPDIFSRMADDSEILAQFKKVAAELKQIAPKAKDFLYFSAVMMHSAEASLLDTKGNIRKDAHGKNLTSTWEKTGESWRWICSDKNVLPYKNSNADIFPEEELIKAHKKWIGRPLCLDHKSSSVDMIRGVIVDTYYDYKCKRVIALCALDKVNYPDLARKVATGYATSVSMGVAVGKAICTDCGKVAKVESDFCDHMIRKSCYGEINVNLSPIELSIVVNGADPNAKIRHIVAAADSIANYVEQKSEQLNKLAEDETKDIELAKEVTDGLAEVQKTISNLQEKIHQLKENEETEQAHQNEQVSKANKEDLVIKNAQPMLIAISNRLEELDIKFNKLFSNKEIEMTTKQGYFQGAGGPNEPTPGKPKYEKEEADKIRNTQDKQIESAVDTGPVTGLFPGDEQKKKELQRIAESKLRRQAALERVKEIISGKTVEAYMQGAGGPNEPTPGKPKYPKEEADKIRANEDKQMNGNPPFPGVGKIDGLYDKDLETKKKWLRASLKAKFIKAGKADGTLDHGNSCWQVFADDKLIMTATVDEITGNRGDSLYNSIATRQFGLDLIAKIKSEGFEKAASLFKAAQDMPASMPPAPPVGAVNADPMTSTETVVDTGKSGDPKEMVAELLRQCQNNLSDLSKAFEAINNEPNNELNDFSNTAGESMEAAATVNLIGIQKKLSKAVRAGLKQIVAELKDHVEELNLAATVVNDEEIFKKASTEGKGALKTVVEDACADARKTLADSFKMMGVVMKYSRGTQSLIKRANKEMEMIKSAQVSLPGIGESSPQIEKSLQNLPGHQKRTNPTTGKTEHLKGGKWFADGTNMYWDGKEYLTAPAPVAHKPVPAGHAPVSGVGFDPGATEEGSHNMGLLSPEQRGKALEKANLPARKPDAAYKGVGAVDTVSKSPMVGKPSDLSNSAHAGEPAAHADDGADKEDAADANDVTVTKTDGTKAEMTKDVAKEVLKDASFDMTTKEGRAAYRAKLAKDVNSFNPVLDTAHPGGGFTTKLETKPTGDLAKVETLEEKHKAMVDVALAPPRVRKMAEEIEKYVKAGKIDPDKDFPGLIAQGLDADAVKYWKQLWNQAKDGGSQFASELIKEHAAAKVAEEKESYKVKVARAYALAYEMADRDLIGRDPSSLNVQVNEILSWANENFDSIKRLIARTPISKKASAMPQVGMIGTGDITIPAPEAEPSTFKVQLESLWTNKRY